MQASQRSQIFIPSPQPRRVPAVGWLGVLICATFLGQSAAILGQKSAPTSVQAGEIDTSVALTPKPPAALDPTGPAISFETNETLFDVMAGLNACGYDDGLASSDPLRQKVRDQMNQALAQSEEARAARDKLCIYVRSHTLADPRRNVSQYISLALYLKPAPDLEPSVADDQLPPDAEPVVNYVPVLKAFAEAANLHLIWALDRADYDAEVNKIHDPVTSMIEDTDIFLKQPPSQYNHRRFLVFLEPLIAPANSNARVYGGDYIVVESPVNGVVPLKAIKHTYLHYELEPMVYARSKAIDKFLPLLKRVQSAPLPFSVKNDILTLVLESMIRAIEAHTIATGIPDYTPPTHIDRSQMAEINSKIVAHDRKVEVVRQRLVKLDIEQGYILTQYFYDQFTDYAANSRTLPDAVGEMVYSINLIDEMSRNQRLVFSDHETEDDVERPTRAPDLLDQAEQSFAAGDMAKAVQLANQALAQPALDAGRAQFILGRAELFSGKPSAAVKAFQQTVQLSHDPRAVSWAHIYLGRIDDVQEDRDDAIAEYQAALQSRDNRPDTKQAAEAGLKAPYHLAGSNRNPNASNRTEQ